MKDRAYPADPGQTSFLSFFFWYILLFFLHFSSFILLHFSSFFFIFLHFSSFFFIFLRSISILLPHSLSVPHYSSPVPPHPSLSLTIPHYPSPSLPCPFFSQNLDLPSLLDSIADVDRIHLCLVNSLTADLHTLLDLGNRHLSSFFFFPSSVFILMMRDDALTAIVPPTPTNYGKILHLDFFSFSLVIFEVVFFFFIPQMRRILKWARRTRRASL